MSSDVTKQQYEKAIQRDFSRNYRAFLLFDMIWGAGAPFFGNAMITALMLLMGSTKELIGVILALPMFMGLSQLLVSSIFRNRRKKGLLITLFLLGPLPWLVYSLLFAFNPDLVSQRTQLILLCVVMSVYWLSTSGIESSRMALLTECIPVNRRGKLFAGRRIVGVVAAFCTWPLAVILMKKLPEPFNYQISFAIALSAFSLAALAYLWIREHQNPLIERRSSSADINVFNRSRQAFGDQWAVLIAILRHSKLRNYWGIVILNDCTMALYGYIAVFGKDVLNLSGDKMVHFSIIQMLGSAVVSHFMGRQADRSGFKRVGVLLSIPMTAGLLLALFMAHDGQQSVALLFISFLLCSMCIASFRMSAINLTAELAPRQEISVVLAFLTTLKIPFVFSLMWLCGKWLDRTSSYSSVFLLAAFMSCICGLLYAFKLVEPRGQKAAS